jgi:hypothetical protein
MDINPSNNLQVELKCLRTHIVDFLVYQLKHDVITEKRAAQLARAVLDQLTDSLSHEQILQVISRLEKQFPEELKNLQSSHAACDTDQARLAIDNQVLKQIDTGNIDAALQTLNQYQIK